MRGRGSGRLRRTAERYLAHMRAQLRDGRVGKLAGGAVGLGPHPREALQRAACALGVAQRPLAHRIESAGGSLVAVAQQSVDRRARCGTEDLDVLSIGRPDPAYRKDYAIPLADPAQPPSEDALLRAEGQQRRVNLTAELRIERAKVDRHLLDHGLGVPRLA